MYNSKKGVYNKLYTSFLKEKKFMNKESEKRIKEKITYASGEDATKYGEFVSSYFAWIPLSEQKETANKLENITDK